LKTTSKHHQNFATQLGDFFHLIYPEKCVSCEGELTGNEGHICSICEADLTETSYHLTEEATSFDKLFWGRVNLSTTFALYQFRKKSVIQSLLFQFKYRHTEDIGKEFGGRMGKRIKTSEKYAGIECLLPVPLHQKKEFVRGYNQSLALAKGISETAGIKVESQFLKRVQNNATQTKKDRFDRWENVASVFLVSENIKKYNHVAIVDDVVTTGSTIEALVRAIKSVHPDIQISVLTLAIA